jgi:hypothetical protein
MDRSTLGQNLRPLERDHLVTLLTEAAKSWRIAQERFEAAFGQRDAAELRAVLHAIAHNEALTKPDDE